MGVGGAKTFLRQEQNLQQLMVGWGDCSHAGQGRIVVFLFAYKRLLVPINRIYNVVGPVEEELWTSVVHWQST